MSPSLNFIFRRNAGGRFAEIYSEKEFL